MNLSAKKFLSAAVCAYECIRLGFIIGAFRVLRPAGEIAFPWLSLIAPGAMFLLIALFWQLDIRRYRLFCPLYLAGKGLSILTTVLWLFFARNDIVRMAYFSVSMPYIMLGIAFFLLLGDMLSVCMALKLMKK